MARRGTQCHGTDREGTVARWRNRHDMATEDPAIEDLARDWLDAERDATSGRAPDDARARSASAAYEEAVTAASREDLLIAWLAAQQRQSETEMGSEAWTTLGRSGSSFASSTRRAPEARPRPGGYPARSRSSMEKFGR